MRYYFDCEFLEAGGESPIHLLSMGVVAEDGRELYFINKDCPIQQANSWVRQNVLPKLDMRQGVSRSECRNRLLEFVGTDTPQFVAYYGSYDWVCLAGLMGRMVDLPKGWPKFPLDVKQFQIMLGMAALPPKPPADQAHNALADARWTRDAWNSLVAESRNRQRLYP
jgi:hypothetical protein